MYRKQEIVGKAPFSQVSNASLVKKGLKKTIPDVGISIPVQTGNNKPTKRTRKKVREDLISNVVCSSHVETQNISDNSLFITLIKPKRTRKPSLRSRKVAAKKKSTRKPKSYKKRITSFHTTKIPTIELRVEQKETRRLKSRKSRTVIKQTSKQSTHLPALLNTNTPISDTMVITSDQFIFRPKIPITEENYPLENMEKTELLSHDSTIGNVLSYGFTDPEIKRYIKFPSVSKIIEETISEKTKLVLGNWRKKMIADLGEDGFYKHSEDLKTRGTEFHMAVRNAVLGKTTENCSEVTQNSLKSLSWMLEHISNPLAVESTIAHPKLGYRGVADCIATFRNIPVIIDWKLSDKPKRDLKDTYDAPVQITAYIGAMNHDPNYKWGVNHGLVAVAYSNGDPCDVFLLAPKHCQIYWRHWLMRFDKFKARSHLHLDHDIDEKSLEMI